MARTFAITPTTDALKIVDNTTPSETTFTVSNASLSPRRCGVTVVPSDPAKPDWFTVKGEPERLLKPGDTTQFTVEVKIPPGTPEGKYQFRLDALDRDNPSEYNTEGPLVGVELTKPTPKIDPKPFPWWIIAVAAVVLIGAGVAVWMLLPKDVTVPNVVGKSFEEASSELTGKKLKVEDEMQVGDQPENTVVKQEPEEGAKLKKGDTVKIVYEAPFVAVPSLVGMEQSAALALLTEQKIDVRSITEQREDPNKAGKVVSQSVPAGEKKRQGDEIDLVVEAAMVRIPKVTTMKAKDAMAELDRVGLKYEISTVTQDASKAGTIVAQKPEPPALVQRGEVITLTAERGRIEAPAVTQKSRQEAEKLVRDAKLKPVVLAPQLFPAAVRVGDIGASDPPPGTPLVEGDEVKLIPAGKPVTMPDVTTSHMTEADAKGAVQRAGLTASVSYKYVAPIKIKMPLGPDKTLPPPNLGRVVDQSPPATTKLVENTAVTIYVVTDKPIKVKAKFDATRVPMKTIKP